MLFKVVMDDIRKCYHSGKTEQHFSVVLLNTYRRAVQYVSCANLILRFSSIWVSLSGLGLFTEVWSAILSYEYGNDGKSITLILL